MKTNIIHNDFLKKDSNNRIVKSNLFQYSSKSLETGYSLKFVSSGKETYHIDGDPFSLNENFALLVNPGQSLELEVESESMVEGFCCFIDERTVNEVVHVYEKTTSKLLDNDVLDFDLNYFYNYPIQIKGTSLSNIIFNIKNTPQNDLMVYDQEDLFFLLAEQMGLYYVSTKNGLSNLKCDKISTRKELFKRIQIGRTYINDNLANPNLRLKDIASASCMSVYHFHRCFKEFFYITPNQYLHINRMILASSIVNSNNHVGKELFRLCGYHDPKYFNKIFKKWSLKN